MLATVVTPPVYFSCWLKEAGTEASSRTLTLANQDIYNTLAVVMDFLPEIWRQGATGTTVNFLK